LCAPHTHTHIHSTHIPLHFHPHLFIILSPSEVSGFCCFSCGVYFLHFIMSGGDAGAKIFSAKINNRRWWRYHFAVRQQCVAKTRKDAASGWIFPSCFLGACHINYLISKHGGK
jgi:hypothetical protein